MRQVSWACMVGALLVLLLPACSGGGSSDVDGDGPGDYDPWDGNREDGDTSLDGDESPDGDTDWERWEEGDVVYERRTDEPFTEWTRETFEGSATDVPKDVVAILPWNNGGAYFGAANGLWRYNPTRPEGQRLYRVANPGGVTDLSVIGMATGAQNVIHLLIRSTGTDADMARMQYEDDPRLVTDCVLFHSPTSITTMGESRWIYIGTNGPVYFFNGTQCTTEMTREWPTSGIRSLSGTRDNRMAILQRIATTSYEGYLFHVWDNTWYEFTLNEGLASTPFIYSVFAVDYPDELPGNQDTWIAHNGGLFRMDRWRAFSRYTGGVCAQVSDTDCGLAWDEVNHVAVNARGEVWAATERGVLMRPAPDRPWKLFHSQRWLLEDKSAVVGFDAEGTTWIGHPGGLTRLVPTTWTLKQKADHIQAIQDARHLRMGGFSVPAALPASGVTDGHTPMINPDEPLQTALYALSQTFRGMVARDENERVAGAKNAWDSLRMMMETIAATAYTEIPEIDGLPARAILPRGEGPLSDPEAGEWNRSSAYDWLGDPDQATVLAHVVAYAFFYDYLADASQKTKLRASMKRLADHLIRNGYRVIDVDGQPAANARFDAAALDGTAGRVGYGGLTALQLLALLRVAHHLTGDAAYLTAYLERGQEKGYLNEVRHQKVQSDERKQDTAADLLAYLAYWVALRYEDRMHIRDIYLGSLEEAWRLDRPTGHPLFNLVYGVVRYTGFDLDGVIEALRAQPADLVDWRVDTCWRRDVALAEAASPDAAPRLLAPLSPAEQRLLNPWDDPYACAWSDADDADPVGGRVEFTGTSYLLPYWMARAYRMLERPAD